MWYQCNTVVKEFLSTLSLRRATPQHQVLWPPVKLFLSTLSLRRATRSRGGYITKIDISIHALLAESDLENRAQDLANVAFLSTLSLRRATLRHNASCSCRSISIHALLAESDIVNNIVNGVNKIFLSTLSLRRATAKVHKTVGHFCAYETNFMGIASSC